MHGESHASTSRSPRTPRSTVSRSDRKASTSSKSRPVTRRSKSRAAPSTSYSCSGNEILCAISEARGIAPTVGLTFLNLSTCEAVLCQFTDTQTFARTCHKIKVFGPTEIIFASTATDSKLISIIYENLEVENTGIDMIEIDRRYWSERIGQEYIQQLAFPEDLEALKLSLTGNYFAVCCFAAALRYLDQGLEHTFAAQSLRIKFESSEGAMMIDLSTIANLELVQNLQNAKSKHCLYGLLNQTLTRMGARLLKNNVLQPSTDASKIEQRWAVVDELSSKEELFFSLRDALKDFVDTDRALANLVLVPKQLNFQYMEQSVNNVLMLKSFIDSIRPVWQILTGVVTSELKKIRDLCDPINWTEVQQLVDYALSPDVSYSQKPADLRNHRVFAIRAGTNGFLDVARRSYNEFVGDAKELVDQLQVDHELNLDLKYDASRQFYIRTPILGLNSPTSLPEPFVNLVRNGKHIECQTLSLVKLNQKIKDVHNEIIAMSDSSIQTLISSVRTKIHSLFKISEGIALLDLLMSFAHIVTTHSYIRPDISTDVLAIKSARHPIREKIQNEKYIPNDVYATQTHKRFQIITGCNMSGKSTYIRSIALLTVMAQIGSFIPAEYASFPISHSLFSRISTDDCSEANVSTFASEMREMSFILRNIEPRSLVIVDELGRGTSTTDGLAIAIAISEALIQSKAHVWFVTHFRDLPRILAERVGVYNMHMHVDIAPDYSTMKMRYKISEGTETQKYYRLALAQLVDLPDEVMEVAVAASRALNARNDEKKGNAKAIVLAKRRKLAIHLRETLMQARDSDLEGSEFLAKMKRVQEEFCVRMVAIEAEYFAAQNDQTRPDNLSEQLDDAPDLESDIPELNRASHKVVPTGAGTDMNTFRAHLITIPARNGTRPAVFTPRTPNEHCYAPQPNLNEVPHSPSVQTRPRTPLTTDDMSWETSDSHENPLFRPMPTDTCPKLALDAHNVGMTEDLNTVGIPTRASMLHGVGNGVDNPIYIDDATSEGSVSSRTSFMDEGVHGRR